MRLLTESVSTTQPALVSDNAGKNERGQPTKLGPCTVTLSLLELLHAMVGVFGSGGATVYTLSSRALRGLENTTPLSFLPVS